MESGIFFLIIQFIVLLLSLSIHESAHAWTADALGDPTARYLGRVSLNPLVHADPFGTFLFPLMGMFLLHGSIFGWAKPVPVNVSRLRNPARDHMLVAAAGPISNLLLATWFFLWLVAAKAMSGEVADILTQLIYGRAADGNTILAAMTAFAFYGMLINLILAVFNLIPVAPLDGAAVLSGLLPRSFSGVFNQMQSYGFVLLIALLYLGVPSMMYSPVINFVLSYLSA
ncbi:MAG TPA: site-2 protease family protein [Terriglobia bacterium]|jgi:Zn-dependent protease